MNKKADIVLLCQYFYPEYVTSAKLAYETAEDLVKGGYKVDVLCGYPKEYNELDNVMMEETYKGIHIKRIKYLQLKRSNKLGRLINYFSFTFLSFFRLGYIKRSKLVIVYSSPPILPIVAWMANKLFGTKIVFVSYDIYPEMAQVTNTISETSLISKVMRFINKRLFSSVDKVVALSNEMKEFLLKNRPQINENQVEVIPNWYPNHKIEDISLLYENQKFKDLDANNNLIISYFGNMGIAQDLDTIVGGIETLKKENNIKFVFAGHGNKMDLLKETVKKEELKNVKFYDFLHGQDYQDALNISDCFLVTLKEGVTGLAVPSKTYSYMSAGKPIIAIMGKQSDIAKDLVENEAGYSLEPGETNKLLEAIYDLKNNESKRIKMGDNCRSIYLSKYTREICTDKYVQMMKEVLGD